MAETYDETSGGMHLAAYDYKGKSLSYGPEIEWPKFQERLRPGGEDGELIAAAKQGLSRSFSNSPYWERLIDGTRCNFGREDAEITGLVSADDEAFYMVLDDGQLAYGQRLLRYRFDENAPSVPQNTLSIFAVQKSETLAQAISRFQIAYPDCGVELRLPPEGMLPREMVRTLQAELSGHGGPDLLFLDGLPAEPLLGTGVLDDLSGLVRSDAYFNNLVSAFEQDGRIEAVPARVIVPVMTGDPELMGRLRSLADLLEEAQKAPRPPADGLPENDSWNPLPKAQRPFLDKFYCTAPISMFYGLCAFPLDSPQAKDELAECLAQIKTLLQLYGIDTANVSEETGWLSKIDSPAVDWLVSGFDPEQYYQGQTRLGMDNCGRTSVFSSWGASSCREDENGKRINSPVGMESLFGKGVYYPTNIAAVNTYSKNREYARKFAGVLLSAQVLTKDTYQNNGEGFPVSREAFEKGVYEEWLVYSRDPAELLESLRVPSRMDREEIVAVLQELPAYSGGEETAEEAAENILAALAG